MEIMKTPLYDCHLKHDARMVDFAGWKMPVQYSGIKSEHLATRSSIGVFDVSHMGEIRLKGSKALETLQWLTTNDASKLSAGEAQYSLFPNKLGGLVDDLIVYCFEPNKDYLLCVNASNTEKDFKYLLENNKGAEITNESDLWAQIAVQGPKSEGLLNNLGLTRFADMKSFTFNDFKFKGETCWAAKTGYTGEDGVEIFIPRKLGQEVWGKIFEISDEAIPCGLGARDTLRMEMKYPLYGNELSDNINPYSSGLFWVIKHKAKDFLGKKVMLEQKTGLKQKLVGISMIDKGIPRSGYKIFDQDEVEIGYVTSGTMSPSLNKPIGIAYVNKKFKEVGSEVYIDMRGTKRKACVVGTPFVNKA